MDETSLTDFLGESAGSGESEEREKSDVRSDERGGSEESGKNDETAEVDKTAEIDAGDTKATISTYGWTPDGTACESCGETVNRRWRDDEQLVCADCKSW